MEQEEIKISQIKVQEPLPNCPVPPPCPVVPKPKPGPVVLRIFLVFILALVLAFVILAASGLRIVRKESLLDIWLSSRKPMPIPAPTLILKPTPTPDPTASWKIYTDEELKFSFKYPEGWEIVSSDKEPSAENIDIFYQKIPLEQYFKSNPRKIDLTEKTDKIIDGETFTRVYGNKDKYQREFAIVSLKEGTLAIEATVDLVDNQKQIEIFDQILSTFKFVSVSSSASGQTKGGLTQGTPVKIKSFSLVSPTKGPLVIKGTVESGWMSEGSFLVKLLDASRQEIASASAKETISGSWQSGKAVEFSVSLTFTTESNSGFLVFQNDNPSGLPENAKSFEIPVKFK